MPSTKSFRADSSPISLASEPAAILQTQAEALAADSDGLLFGTVEPSEAPPIGEVAYDLYINVNNKPYRYLLLSVQHSLRSDCPIRISNTLAETITQVHDMESLKRHLRLIFHAPATVQLLERMKAFARQTAS